MKALKTVVFCLALSCVMHSANAQSDSAVAAQRALSFADSFSKSFRYSEWDDYISLSCPGVIKYYGGREGYKQYVIRARATCNVQQKEKMELIQLINDIREWQCVVRRTRETVIDGRKAEVISYLVGQSKDEGLNWKYFDVAYNSVENVIYIMPDIFDRLAIPQRQIIYEKEQLARKD